MKKIIGFGLVIILILMYSFGFSDPLIIVTDSAANVEKNLVDLSNEEKEILEELFLILQEIKEMELIEKNTALEVDELKLGIDKIELLIELESSKYNTNLDIMEEVLKSYQRNGAITYLDLILSSDSLETLLRRINAIRDISRNTSTLLEDIEISKEKLIQDKVKLADTLIMVVTRQREIKLAIEKKLILKDSLETRLASLKEDKAKYEEYLVNLENSWDEITPLFSETINMLVKIVEEGNLPEETVEISFSTSGVKGIIREEVLRDILALQPFPTRVELEFYEDKMELIMPDINIYMSGTLEVLNPQALVFVMTEGKYLGMKLEDSAMEELFDKGYLELNFKQLLNKSTIKSIKMNENNLELYINPVLF